MLEDIYLNIGYKDKSMMAPDNYAPTKLTIEAL